MTILSFKQVESNHGKRGLCKPGCTWIIKLSHCLGFGYRNMLVFNSNSKWLYTPYARRKTFEQSLTLFKEELISF